MWAWIATAAVGCGEPEPAAPGASAHDAGTTTSSACAPGEALLETAACLPAGSQPDGCPAGEHAQGGTCVPAGVPPDACAQGFEPADFGCRAVLPASPCASGSFAIPGEASCHEVAPCGAAPWGDAPLDAQTQHVDPSFAGTSDGSAASPWTTIQAAVDAAPPGGLVAIAAGSYAEAIAVADKAIRLWGRCPSLVEIAAPGAAPAIELGSGADGSRIHGVGVTGAGVVVTGSIDVVLERTWIHDTEGPALSAGGQSLPASVSVTDSLFERARQRGVWALGATLTLERSAVRATRSLGDGTWGRGVDVRTDPATSVAASGTLRRSVVEQSHELGVAAKGSEVVLEGVVVRDTLAEPATGELGWGVAVADDPELGRRGRLTMRGSVIERSHEYGVVIFDSDADIDATVVRETLLRASDEANAAAVSLQELEGSGPPVVTLSQSLVDDNPDTAILVAGADATISATRVRATQPGADGARGIGVQVQPFAEGGRGSAVMRACVVEQAHELGVLVLGSDATLDGTLVRQTEPSPADGGGIGVWVQPDGELGLRGSLVLSSSVVTGSHHLGVLISGSDALVSATVIEATKPDAGGTRGRGLQIQPSDSGAQSSGRVDGAVVRDVSDAGVAIIASSVELRRLLVENVAKQGSDGKMGDGVVVFPIEGGPAATVELGDSRVEGSARAGVASFGLPIALERSVLSCNAVDLDREALFGTPGSVEDRGGNVCGCADRLVACQTASLGLEAPSP